MRVRAKTLLLFAGAGVLVWVAGRAAHTFYRFSHVEEGPTAAELAELVRNHRRSLKRIRDALLADASSRSARSRSTRLGDHGPIEWYLDRTGFMGDIVRGEIHSSGNVVCGLTVEIVWVPEERAPYVIAETRESDGRRVWERLEGEWWGFWQR